MFALLQIPVTRQLVYKILRGANQTICKDSPVPALSVPWERRMYTRQMRLLLGGGQQWDKVVYCDAKT